MYYSLNAQKQPWPEVCKVLMSLQSLNRTVGVGASLWVDRPLEREATSLARHLDLADVVEIHVDDIPLETTSASEFLAGLRKGRGDALEPVLVNRTGIVGGSNS